MPVLAQIKALTAAAIAAALAGDSKTAAVYFAAADSALSKALRNA